MTTLAGAVPRMMRPGPGQNYPRSGFPLEGKRGPRRRPSPGWARAAPRYPGSPQAPLARPGTPFLSTPTPGGKCWGEICTRFSLCKWSVALSESPFAAWRPGLLPARPRCLLFWKIHGGEGMSRLLSNRKQLLRILPTQRRLQIAPALPILAKPLLSWGRIFLAVQSCGGEALRQTPCLGLLVLII